MSDETGVVWLSIPETELQNDARVVFEREFNQDLIGGYFLEDFPFLCQNWDHGTDIKMWTSNGSVFISSPEDWEQKVHR